jgi:uncharacterized protein (TIGR02266 family)
VNAHDKGTPSFTGSIEDRTEERHGVDLTVTVNSDHNFYACFARNLSAGGIFVATPIVHPVGTQFTLSIHIDDGAPGVVRGVGEVRWIRAVEKDSDLPAGLGIRFTEIYGDGAERIERFLARRGPMEEPEGGNEG